MSPQSLDAQPTTDQSSSVPEGTQDESTQETGPADAVADPAESVSNGSELLSGPERLAVDGSADTAATAAVAPPAIDPPAPQLALSEVSAPAQKHPSAWRRIGKAGLWGALFSGTAIASALAGATLALSLPLPGQGQGPTAQAQSQGQGLGELWKSGFRYQVTRPVNLLLMGIDEVPNVPETSKEIFAGRTDTLLLVRVDPENHAVNLLSIPRDTRVRIPGYETAKINHANLEGGPELVAQTIAYNLGPVPVDRYVRVSTGAFREIVDLVGGVEIYVPKRMVYEDQTQKLFIDLYPGWQTLNGDQAEQFARFRKDETGDIGRVQRQQMLLKALRQRLTSPAVIPKLPQIIRVLQRYVDTNLSPEEMLALANFALGLQPDDLHMVMLPGRFSAVNEYNASYWLADWNKGSTILQSFFQVENVATLADHTTQAPSELSIAVQNASGSPELATEVARSLRDRGFYNVYVTPDWPAVEPTTQIIAQQGDLESARSLESVLTLGRVVADSTGDLQSDITVRIGQDWTQRDTVEAAPTGP